MEITLEKLKDLVRELESRRHTKIKIVETEIFSKGDTDVYWELIDIN